MSRIGATALTPMNGVAELARCARNHVHVRMIPRIGQCTFGTFDGPR